MGDVTRISMWSGPRNISTTMMRAFGNRPDTIVVDEPFYACYLKASGAAHPYRDETLAAMPADYESARKRLAGPLPAGKAILFAKHIAYHYPASEPLGWLGDHRVFLLIRDPRAMIASYAKKYADIAPIIESFTAARRIYEDRQARGRPCPVVDAADILADPRALLGALCAALAIPYTDEMLAWPPGPRATDGPWAPHWYDAVNASTGFRAAPATPAILNADEEALAAAAAAEYQFFRERRISPSRLR